MSEPLPEGWTEYQTENGTSYFHHETLGTQWERPKASNPVGKSTIITDNNGDDFMKSLSNFFGAQGGSTSHIEGNLRGDPSTPKGFLARAMNLQKYFQLTGDEFIIRCMSVFTMISGLFQSNGTTQIQSSLFVDKPDLYGPMWISATGSVIIGFLPNLCESLITGRPTQFSDYSSGLMAFFLFPIIGFIAYAAAYVTYSRQNNSFATDDAFLPLYTSICILGYAELPVILALPVLMINSWLFRFLILCIALAVSISFVYIIIRGSSESFTNLSSPRKVQFMVIATGILIPYICIMLKLPTLHQSQDIIVDASIFAADDDSVKALAEVVKESLVNADDDDIAGNINNP